MAPARALQAGWWAVLLALCPPTVAPPMYGTLPAWERPPARNITIWGMHIPKTAGSAFDHSRKQLVSMLPPHVLVRGTGEVCFKDAESTIDAFHAAVDNRVIVFLREPRPHVQSLYYQSLAEAFMQNIHTHFDNITVWLRHFAGVAPIRRGHTYSFYNPNNLQTRAFACTCRCLLDGEDRRQKDRHNGQSNRALWTGRSDPSSFADATRNMGKLFMVGVVEYYLESVCLLIANLAQSVPPICNCSDAQARAALKKKFPMFRPRLLKKHSFSDLTEEDLALIDNLTQNDAVVYSAGLSRFHDEVRAAERAHGVPLLCNFTVPGLRSPPSSEAAFPAGAVGAKPPAAGAPRAQPPPSQRAPGAGRGDVGSPSHADVVGPLFSLSLAAPCSDQPRRESACDEEKLPRPLPPPASWWSQSLGPAWVALPGLCFAAGLPACQQAGRARRGARQRAS